MIPSHTHSSGQALISGLNQLMEQLFAWPSPEIADSLSAEEVFEVSHLIQELSNQFSKKFPLPVSETHPPSPTSDHKITALTRQVESLRATLDARDKLFSIIAHDLKGPFNGILGFSEILKDQASGLDAETLSHYAGIVFSQAYQAFRLVDNLLIWTRIQQGRVPFKPMLALIKKTTDEPISSFLEHAEKKGISLLTSIPGNMAAVADQEMLKVMVTNLVANGVKYSSKGGAVELGAKTLPEGFEIWVADTGIGMTPDRLEAIFGEGPLVTERGTDNEKGSGLGLILCKSFTAMHSGRFWAESEPGKGSTFHVFIPSLQQNT